MGTCVSRRLSGLMFVAVVMFLSVACAASPKVPANWHSGVGMSELGDALAAGDAAAAEAKRKLGGVPAKIVFVGAAEPLVTPALIEGVTKHFDPAIVYGCQITSPLIPATNFPDVKTIDVPVGVTVWALGGDMDVKAFSVATNEDHDDPYEEAGIALGALIRPSLEATKRPGRVIVTFGDQYNGANKDFARGLNEGLGGVYPVVGAAAGNITAKEIVQGKIVSGVNVGILISGDFRVTQALNGGTHTPETADKTLAQAIAQGDGQDPFFALIFNCRRRRQGMIERNQLGEELDVIRKKLPGVDFFGFYGPGEIGSDKAGAPAIGVGFTVVTAVFFAVPGK